MEEFKFPLGIAKQAVMKLDSLMVDLAEMAQEESLDESIRDRLEQMVEMSSFMAASLVNMISNEIGEDEFMGEDVPIDELNDYPEIQNDEAQNLLNEEILEVNSSLESM